MHFLQAIGYLKGIYISLNIAKRKSNDLSEKTLKKSYKNSI